LMCAQQWGQRVAAWGTARSAGRGAEGERA
jgi:hypothetical protein